MSYPINSYCVSMNIADYETWSDEVNGLALDYYVLGADLEKPQEQCEQVELMLAALVSLYRMSSDLSEHRENKCSCSHQQENETS